jgi:nitrate/nitrite transporter NarK
VQEKDIDSIYARIDNVNGLLVQHPDMLISPTRIADAIGCVRRGVISERGKALGAFSKPAVLGNLRHSFIEVTRVLYVMFLILIFCSVMSHSSSKYQQSPQSPV